MRSERLRTPRFQKNSTSVKKYLTNLFVCGIIFVLEIWVWRRLVARYLGVVEVAGSNPVTQTILTSRKWLNRAVCGISLFRGFALVHYLSIVRDFLQNVTKYYLRFVYPAKMQMRSPLLRLP